MQVIRCSGVNAAKRVAGQLLNFRAPHHTSSLEGLKEEFYLASGGVLYLDDVGDFPRQSIEVLAARIRHNYPHPPLALIIDSTNRWGDDGGARAYGKRVVKAIGVLEEAVEWVVWEKRERLKGGSDGPD